MPKSNISVVSTGPKKCKPFQVEVSIKPPSGKFSFDLIVEKGCTPENDAIWKLVFDLYKKIDGQFTQIAHISFKAGNETEKRGIKDLAVNPITDAAAKVAIEEVLPLAEKAAEPNPPADLSKQLKKGMSKIAVIQLEGDSD